MFDKIKKGKDKDKYMSESGTVFTLKQIKDYYKNANITLPPIYGKTTTTKKPKISKK